MQTQRGTQLRIGLVLLGFFWTFCLGATTDAPTTQPTEPSLPADGQFTAKVEQLLGVKETGVDVLPLIADAIKTENADPAAQGAALDKLVNGLLAGPHPTILLDKILPELDKNFRDFAQEHIPGWEYGAGVERLQVEKSLWRLAKAAQEKNPKRASEVARASLLLSALDFRTLGTLALLLNKMPGDPYQKLLLLPDMQYNQLLALLEKYDSQEQRYNTDENMKTLRAMDALNESKSSSISLEAVNGVLASFDDIYRNGVANYGWRLDITTYSWHLLNLVRSRQSPDGEAAVKKQLEIWKHDFPDIHLQSWINQALAATEPSVPILVHDFIMRPDGKIVPKPRDIPKK